MLPMYECIAKVSGYLEGDFEDWPSHIQDRLYLELEKKSQAERKSLKIVFGICDFDHEDEEWFVRVTAVQDLGTIQ